MHALPQRQNIREWSLRATGVALIVASGVSVFACGGGESDRRATPTVGIVATASPSPKALAPSGDPGVTVENVVLACREKDADRLRSFVAAPSSDEEIQALFARGTDVMLKSAMPQAQGDRATVDVRLEVRREGEGETVERSWELERGADGGWRLTELPDCY